MALRIVASRPDPAIVTLPWATPLEEWGEPHVVPLPRGLSRHVVRIVQLHGRVYAVKETVEDIAFREYRVLRDLQRLGLPSVVPQGVVTGRTDEHGEELPAALLTQHLRFSLPYRSLFEHGLPAQDTPLLIDALVVLLVRLHLADFYWGDVSLSNVLFRRDAGGFAAYLVDAETGELRDSISDRLRAHDLTVACENVFAELLDLQASGALETGSTASSTASSTSSSTASSTASSTSSTEAAEEVDPYAIIDRLRERYDALWRELTDAEQFPTDEMWRIEQRIERLNDLGFDVEELDIVTDFDGDQIRLQPRVVEAGHHARELRALTGLDVQDAQARRMLNDIAAYTASRELHGMDRLIVAQRWLREIYQPIVAMIPAGTRGKLEPAEIFHEILVHRWFLSEREGRSVKLLEAAASYVQQVLPAKPEEAVAELQ